MLRELFGAPKPKQAPASASKPAAPAPVSQSVLGAETHFEGTLRADGHVRVDGTFVGDISTKGRILVGEQARVDGDLVAEVVDVAGMVKGDITARRISVTRTGRVLGDLRLEKLLTEEGGFIQGLVRMEEKVTIIDYLPTKNSPGDEPLIEKEASKEAPTAAPELVKEKVPVKAGK